MITIFTTPKPFRGHNCVIQRNALKSWLQTQRECEVILFGDDDGVADVALEFGVKHIPSIEKNELGTPLLGSIFSIAQEHARYDTLMYINADIILTKDVVPMLSHVEGAPYLLSGRRWDMDIVEEIDCERSGWADAFLRKARESGCLHGYSGMDYFIFPRNQLELPPFAVGRPGWDSWLIYDMKMRHIPVVDATASISIIHQNHDYSHSPYGGKKRVSGPEWKRNLEIAGGLANMLTLRDADLVLGSDGLRRPQFRMWLLSKLSSYRAWRYLLALKRILQNSCRT